MMKTESTPDLTLILEHSFATQQVTTASSKCYSIHDLALLLLPGLDKALRDARRDELIKTYHQALCTRLEEIGLALRQSPTGVAPMGPRLIYSPMEGRDEEVFERVGIIMNCIDLGWL